MANRDYDEFEFDEEPPEAFYEIYPGTFVDDLDHPSRVWDEESNDLYENYPGHFVVEDEDDWYDHYF